MKKWVPVAAISGITAIAVLSYAWVSWQGRDQILTVPEGTKIHVRLQTAISTRGNTTGDPFKANLNASLVIDDKVVAPTGSEVLGELTKVEDAGRIAGRAELTMVLCTLVVSSVEYDISTLPITFKSRGTKKEDAQKIGGGTAGGAAVGALTAGGVGAAIGAGIGASTGLGYVLMTKGEPVTFGAETLFTFTLSAPLKLPAFFPINGAS